VLALRGQAALDTVRCQPGNLAAWSPACMLDEGRFRQSFNRAARLSLGLRLLLVQHGLGRASQARAAKLPFFVRPIHW
jgi:hypothetical protein